MVTKEAGRKDYNLGVLKHVQAIFAHLACSRLQYYVPRGFWKHFRSVVLQVSGGVSLGQVSGGSLRQVSGGSL